MSNCFQKGMTEKGCSWEDPEAVWSHYGVYNKWYVCPILRLASIKAN
jgi:hypothetical protein